MLKGIDVSKHQGTIDWGKVKASGVQFAMLRACYGWDNDAQIDSTLQANARGAAAAGIPYGLYHYSYAETVEQAHKEAAFFLRVIADLRPEYPVVFDFEEKRQLALPPAQQLKLIEAFLGDVETAGCYGMLYMSASSLERLRAYAPQSLAKYDCWVAHINTDKPAYNGAYGMWQYSWKGCVPGIAGDVDQNYAYKDYAAIIKGAGLNGHPAPPTAPVEPDPNPAEPAPAPPADSADPAPPTDPADYKALYTAAKAAADQWQARAKAAEERLAQIAQIIQVKN